MTKDVDVADAGLLRRPSFKIRYIPSGRKDKKDRITFKNARGPGPVMDKDPMPRAVQVAVEKDLPELSPTTPASPCTASPQSIPKPLPPNELSSKSVSFESPEKSTESPASSHAADIASSTASGGLHDCRDRHMCACG